MTSQSHYERERYTMTNYAFWMLVVQGILFLLVGILILLNPLLLFVLAVLEFLWLGITTLLLAFRVRQYRERTLSESQFAHA